MSDLDINVAIKPIGESLVEFSRHARTSARGLIGALFPYILAASKRMSTRAISEYLEQVHKVNISAATIAKALREPQKHLAQIAESAEPAARVVSDALGIEIIDLLSNYELFEASADASPSLWGNTEDELSDAHHAYLSARRHLKDFWFSMDGTVRAMTLLEIDRSDEVEEKGVGDE